jgi:hypothetical protein
MANTTEDLMEGFNLQYCARYTCVSNKGRGDLFKHIFTVKLIKSTNVGEVKAILGSLFF